MHELNVIKQRERIGDLGPHQIETLRKSIPAFNESWTSVQQSDRHAEEIRAKLGVKQ